MAANNNRCVAIKTSGHVCGKRCTGQNVRCGQHITVLQNNGPFMNARNELSYSHKLNLKNLKATHDALVQQEQNPDIRNELRVRFRHEQEALILRQRHEMDDLLVAQTRQIRETGIDPDEAARQRRIQRQAERDRIWRENNQIVFGNHADGRAFHVIPRVAPAVGPVNNELRQFAQDAQNVHTTAAVKQTKDMIERILKIPVPAEYRWNMNECSKTVGEIIIACKLTPKSAWQMSAKYCQDEDIYDLGKGIYGKVLDGVWQYIKSSPDKEDLYRALKQEMEDNIGMCAQGNLSRLCNILAGYMEGIGSQESLAEVLGRMLPKLMEIETQSIRLEKAYQIFMELGVPEDQWLMWAEPLVDSGELKIVKGLEGRGLAIVTL